MWHFVDWCFFHSNIPLKVSWHHLLALRPALEEADSDFELRGRDDRGLADWGRPDEGVGWKSDDTEGLADLGGVGVNLGDWMGGALFGLGGGDGVERYRSLVSKGGTADVRSVLDITWSLSMN